MIKGYFTLYGMTKNEVALIMGGEPDSYENENNEWIYIIKKYWWGKKLILCILFNYEAKVYGVYIDVMWGKYL